MPPSFRLAYILSILVTLVGFGFGMIGHDPLAEMAQQKRDLAASSLSVPATITHIESGQIMYEYESGNRKHYGSSRTDHDGEMAVGQKIDVTVSRIDPDLSYYHPERAAKGPAGSRVPQIVIIFTGVAALITTAALDFGHRRRDG